MFMAFDLLQLDTDDLRTQPLSLRRECLETVLDGAPAVLLPVRRLADHGLKAWQEVLDHGYEGLVAKDPESAYLGGRSLRWLKVKQRDYRVKERGFYDPERGVLWMQDRVGQQLQTRAHSLSGLLHPDFCHSSRDDTPQQQSLGVPAQIVRLRFAVARLRDSSCQTTKHAK